ncbi:hypothetical protein LTR53_014211 [Teratosphaeriaceae sp. CCFEE 6253]|nr:hypothetical protein LTR53_014211 [Teratosphaeriaceae sp. CCFEE 6253]
MPPSSTQAPSTSRASSCVTCRQVKLKCDRRERYPSPCTRCASAKVECRTDAGFKRFSSRARVKELEKEVERLQRAQSLEQVLSARPAEPHEGSDSSHSMSPYSPPAAPVRWLQAEVDVLQTPLQLGNAFLPLAAARVLLQDFEALYLPHFTILEAVTSIREFAQKHELLFWSIVTVVARRKEGLAEECVIYQQAFDELLGRVCREAIQSLTDLQAILLTCTWPVPLRGGQRDGSWMRLGMAINTARQMGIDKQQDEVLFGARRARFRLSQHPKHIIKLTWLKCFELDVQLSSWLGHTPTLGTAQHLRSVALFALDPAIPREYAATIDVHLVTVQYLSVDRSHLAGVSSVDAARMSLAALDMVKAKRTSAWSIIAEAALLAAKQHVTVMGLLSLSGDKSNQDALHEATMMGLLQAAEETARHLIDLLSNLSDGDEDGSPSGHQEMEPLPGYPKNYSCIAFFAATVICYCIDTIENAAVPVRAEAARNALGRVYRLFTKCARATEHQMAARNLDVAIKGIGRGRVWFKSMVKTRSAASLVYSMIWLAGVARGKADDPEFSIEAAERQAMDLRAVESAAQSVDFSNADWWMDLGSGDEMQGFFEPLTGYEGLGLEFDQGGQQWGGQQDAHVYIPRGDYTLSR